MRYTLKTPEAVVRFFWILRVRLGRFILPQGVIPVLGQQLGYAHRQLIEAERFVSRSGHLQTVSGRKPHAVKKLRRRLQTAQLNILASVGKVAPK